MEVDLVGLFGDLVRLETDLWNRVDTRIREEHGLALAWLEPMQIISATPDCRVLHIADALFITVGRDKQACRQDRSQPMVQSATESHRRPLESNRMDADWPGSSPRSQRHFHRSPCGLYRRGRTRKRPQPAVEQSASATPTSDDHCGSGAPGGAAAGVDQVNI